MSERSGTEVRSSVCALDCPDTCAIDVHIDGTGRAVRLAGNRTHPVTQGFLCAKVTRYLDRQYHPDRLLYPMRRTGEKGEGRFERFSWDEALDSIAKRLRQTSEEFGSESILPYSYGGTMGYLNGSGMDRRFFHRLGASLLDRTICASAGGEALMRSQGIRLGIEPQAFAHAKLIIAWGANVLGTNVHLWPFIVEARRRGARFYVIDPVCNRTGRAADRHFAINPGSDLALTLGMMHVILRDGLADLDYVHQHSEGFDELRELASGYKPDVVAHWTGLPAVDIEQLAREYASTQPAAIRLNYGLQRSERGGSAVRAVAALPVLTGAWRHVGGGLQLTTSGAFQLDKTALEMPELQERSPLGRQARVVNMSQLGSALLRLNDPPVKALVVYNSNPALVAPNQSAVLAGLRRPDLFTVVLEHMPTDTARYADIVLPATTFLEHTDLYFAYGHYYLQLARPALAARGEARSNVETFRALAKRMGFTESCFDESEDEMIGKLLRSSSPYLQGITLEELERDRFIRLQLPNGCPEHPAQDGRFRPFAAGGFRTTSGRFEFGAASLSYRPPYESRYGEGAALAAYPLELVTNKSDGNLNSTFAFRSENISEASRALLHPTDAAARGIEEGDSVLVRNDRGACTFRAHLSTDVRPGVVSVCGLKPNSSDGGGINRLISERLTDLGAGATFYSCLVEVERQA